MPAFSASAPGKIILFGEHAVVYNHPAIAAPVNSIRAKATIIPNPTGATGEIHISAPDIGLNQTIDLLPGDHPIAFAIHQTMATMKVKQIPSFHIKITSSIPLASGLGSGAAVSVAIIKVVAGFLGSPLTNLKISEIAFEVDKLHHGLPSGIDNTVVTYGFPIVFNRGEPFRRLTMAVPVTLIIGDTGLRTPTKQVVSAVQENWANDPIRVEAIFSSIGAIALQAEKLLNTGNLVDLGKLMNENHSYLCELGASCPELDRLVHAAQNQGAYGAKMSGGGRGGNMIALVNPGKVEAFDLILKENGATRTIQTTIAPFQSIESENKLPE